MSERIICPLTGNYCEASCGNNDPKCESQADQIVDDLIELCKSGPSGEDQASFVKRGMALLRDKITSAENELKLPGDELKHRVKQHIAVHLVNKGIRK